MFKLLVLSAIVAIASAAPSHHHGLALAPVLSHSTVEKSLEHVGFHESVESHVENHVSDVVVGHTPTAVSHSSRTDYHSTPVVKPILAKVVPPPVITKTITPVVKAHHELTPITHTSVVHQPIVHEKLIAEQRLIHSAPIHHAEPLIHHAEPLIHHAEPLIHHAEPLLHSAPVLATDPWLGGSTLARGC